LIASGCHLPEQDGHSGAHDGKKKSGMALNAIPDFVVLRYAGS
jgi:hypothetical protein